MLKSVLITSGGRLAKKSEQKYLPSVECIYVKTTRQPFLQGSRRQISKTQLPEIGLDPCHTAEGFGFSKEF